MIPQPTPPSYNIPNSHPSTSPVYSSASLDGGGYTRPPGRVHPPTNPYSMQSQLPRVPDRCEFFLHILEIIFCCSDGEQLQQYDAE